MRLDMLDMAGEVGVKWTATERVHAEGRGTGRLEDGPDSAGMEEERGCAWHMQVQGHHTTHPSTDNVGEDFTRKDQEKSRFNKI